MADKKKLDENFKLQFYFLIKVTKPRTELPTNKNKNKILTPKLLFSKAYIKGYEA